MTEDKLLRFVRSKDEDLIRSYTDDLVYEAFKDEARELIKSDIEENIEYLLDKGHDPASLYNALKLYVSVS